MKSIWAGLGRIVLICGCMGLISSARGGGIDVWYPEGYGVVAGGARPTVIEGNTYQLWHNLTLGQFDKLYLKTGATPGTNVFAGGPVGGLTLSVTDSTGKVYSSIYANGSQQTGSHGGTPLYVTAMQLHNQCKLYTFAEIHDVIFRASDSTLLPMTASINIHQWGDRMYFEVIFKATASVTLQRAEIVCSFSETVFNRYRTEAGVDTAIPGSGVFVSATAGTGVVLASNSGSGAGSLGWIIGDTAGTLYFQASRGTYGLQTTPAVILRQVLIDAAVTGSNTTLSGGQTRSAYFQLFCSGSNSTTTAHGNLLDERQPLTLQIMGSSSGVATLGSYNRRIGYYVVNIPSGPGVNTAGYRFSHLDQNAYDTVTLRIPANARARKNRVCIVQPTGLWGSGVTADQYGKPMGGAVAVTRGMRSFHEVDSTANQQQVFMHKGTFKRWGENPAYLISSEDLALFDPLGQMWQNAVNGINGGWSFSLVQRIYSSMCDTSGIDGNPKFGDDAQPFPENTGGHEFLKYQATATGSTWNKIEFRGLEYERLSPSLVDLNWRGFSADKKITTQVELTNMPFTDTARLFVRMRYDVNATVAIGGSGSMKTKLRLFTMGDENYGQSSFAKFAWTDASGVVQTMNWANNTIGIPLRGPRPFAVVYPQFVGNRGMVLRSYEARINGAQNNNPAITLQTSNGIASGFRLVPDSNATQLIAGDYFDIEMELVYYGTEASDYTPVQAEATAFGTGALQITPTRGTLLRTLPTRLQADAQGRAQFTMQGGRNYVPIEISGLDNYTDAVHKPPLLERLINGCWVPYDATVKGNDGWDVWRDETTGKYAFIYSVWTDGTAREFRFSLSRGRLDAEDYTGFSDGTAGNGGGLYRSDNVDIFANAQGGYHVGSTEAGEWLEWSFTNEAAAARLFTPQLRRRNPAAAAVRLAVNGTNQGVASLNAAPDFTLTDLPDITLQPGVNTIRLDFLTGTPEVDYLQLLHERPAPTIPYDAVVTDYTFPTIFNKSETHTVSLTVKNIGSAAWNGSIFGLAALDLFGSNTFLPLEAGELVAPGASRTFSIDLDGPLINTPSQYQVFITQWRMRNSGTPFGALFKKEVQTSEFYGIRQGEPINFSFEDGGGNVADAWTAAGAVDRRNEVARTGSWSARFVEPGDSTMSQTIGIIPGHEYRMSAWFKSGTNPIELQTRFLFYSYQIGNYIGGNSVLHNGTFDWYKQELVFNAGVSDQALFQFSLVGSNAQVPYGYVYMDDVVLEDLTAPPPPDTGVREWRGYAVEGWHELR